MRRGHSFDHSQCHGNSWPLGRLRILERLLAFVFRRVGAGPNIQACRQSGHLGMCLWCRTRQGQISEGVPHCFRQRMSQSPVGNKDRVGKRRCGVVNRILPKVHCGRRTRSCGIRRRIGCAIALGSKGGGHRVVLPVPARGLRRC